MTESNRGTAAAEWRENWTLVLAAASAVSLSAVSMTTLGVMIGPIEQELGWSRTEITSGPSLISITGIIFSTAVGLAIDRLGYRRIGILTAALMFGSTALMSGITESLWTWWALWAVFGLAAAASPGVFLLPITSTFMAGRGLALAIAFSGTAVTSTFAPIIANYLVENYGWRTAYLGIAAIWGVIAFPPLFLFFRPRASVRPEAVRQVEGAPPPDLPGLTVRQGIRSPALYKIMLGGVLSSAVGTSLSLNLVPILVLTGLSRGTAAAAAGTMGLSMLVGKLIGGVLLDRMAAKTVACIAPIGAMALPLALLTMPGSFTAAITGIMIYGLMAGVKMPTGVYLISRHLGSRSFGTIYGTINAISGVAVGLAPMAASYVYDTTRSYDLVLWIAFPVLLISALLFTSLGGYPDFAKREATA